jgi:hypothetical protein
MASSRNHSLPANSPHESWDKAVAAVALYQATYGTGSFPSDNPTDELIGLRALAPNPPLWDRVDASVQRYVEVPRTTRSLTNNPQIFPSTSVRSDVHMCFAISSRFFAHICRNQARRVGRAQFRLTPGVARNLHLGIFESAQVRVSPSASTPYVKPCALVARMWSETSGIRLSLLDVP